MRGSARSSLTTARSEGKLLFTVAEAAAALGIGRTMLYRLIGTGQLRPVHIGRLTRFTAHELDRFVDHIEPDGTAAIEQSRSA